MASPLASCKVLTIRFKKILWLLAEAGISVPCPVLPNHSDEGFGFFSNFLSPVPPSLCSKLWSPHSLYPSVPSLLNSAEGGAGWAGYEVPCVFSTSGSYYPSGYCYPCTSNTLKFPAHAMSSAVERTIFTVLSLKGVSFGSTQGTRKDAVVCKCQQQKTFSLGAHGVSLVHLSLLYASVDPKQFRSIGSALSTGKTTNRKEYQ